MAVLIVGKRENLSSTESVKHIWNSGLDDVEKSLKRTAFLTSIVFEMRVVKAIPHQVRQREGEFRGGMLNGAFVLIPTIKIETFTHETRILRITRDLKDEEGIGITKNQFKEAIGSNELEDDVELLAKEVQEFVEKNSDFGIWMKIQAYDDEGNMLFSRRIWESAQTLDTTHQRLAEIRQ